MSDHAEPSPPAPSLFLTRDYGSGSIRSARRAGDIEQLRPGAWTAPPPADEPWWETRTRTEVARCHALDRQLRSPHVFCLTTAALLHGCRIWRLWPGSDVAQRSTAERSRSKDLRRHRFPVSEQDITDVAGLRVTSLERTLVDCARFLHPRDATVVVDSGLRILAAPDKWNRVSSDEQVAAARRRLLSRLEGLSGRRGVRRARAVITHADPYAESASESVLRWTVTAHGCPPPTAQFRIDVDGRTFFTDLTWKLEEGDLTRLVHAEFDGLVKYGGDRGTRALADEKAREDLIRERGDVFRRFGTADLSDEQAVVRRLASAFPPGVRGTLAPVPDLLGAPRPRRR